MHMSWHAAWPDTAMSPDSCLVKLCGRKRILAPCVCHTVFTVLEQKLLPHESMVSEVAALSYIALAYCFVFHLYE